MVAFDNLAFVVDPDEIRRLDQAKAHAEAVHPEGIGELRIARGDVTGDPLVESEPCEKPESGSEPFFPVLPLFGQRLEDRWLRQAHIHLRCGLGLLIFCIHR